MLHTDHAPSYTEPIAPSNIERVGLIQDWGQCEGYRARATGAFLTEKAEPSLLTGPSCPFSPIFVDVPGP